MPSAQKKVTCLLPHTGRISKTALVERALRLFVHVQTEEEKRRVYREQVGELQPCLDRMRLSESTLDILRADRERR